MKKLEIHGNISFELKNTLLRHPLSNVSAANGLLILFWINSRGIIIFSDSFHFNGFLHIVTKITFWSKSRYFAQKLHSPKMESCEDENSTEGKVITAVAELLFYLQIVFQENHSFFF